MAYPRSLLVPPDAPGTYHCVSRCVRRAYLCGEDGVTGRSFEHRKQWLEERILELGALFAVAIQAYAVMSNHVHVVLDIDPHAPRAWSDDEVARRWLALGSTGRAEHTSLESRIRALAAQPERLAVLRERLGSLSWFMRYLKEPIARQANREDECTGRFWEGRFKTQDLRDDPAVLTAMVYVDLNPLRAGVADRPEHGPNTSLHRRLAEAESPEVPLNPVAASIRGTLPELTLESYLDIVNWTAGELHGGSDRKGTATPLVPKHLPLRARQWLLQVPAIENRFWRAIGTSQSLLELAGTLGQRWIRGLGTARAFEKVPDTS